MADFFNMPRLGQSMEEGTVLQWFKREGDEVKVGEPLLEVMSDKANFEVEATAYGVLRKVLVQLDDTVPVGEPIAIIGTADEPIDYLLSRSSNSDKASVSSVSPDSSAAPLVRGPASTAEFTVSPVSISISPRARRLADEKSVPVSALAGIGSGPKGRVIERDVVAFLERSSAMAGGGTGESIRHRATPLAAKMADDLGLDLGDLALGLPGSRVTADVVRRHAELDQGRVQTTPGSLAIAQVIPMRGLRKIIADNVSQSRLTTPHVTLVSEVDMSVLASQFYALRSEVERTHGVKLSYTDVIIKAAARALEDHPLANSALVEGEIHVYSAKNIGVAVAAEAGLIVPVVRNADRKSLGDISSELKAMVDRCRNGKQTKNDLDGGTFTITNLGAYGVDSFDPIIVSPQACILGVGRIAEKPVVVNGTVVARSMMNLCLSFDHRIIDGAPAALFLKRVRDLLQSPVLIFQ